MRIKDVLQELKKYKNQESVERKTLMYYKDFGNGWLDLVIELTEKLLQTENGEAIKVLQIKEKFGGLRYYVSGATEEQYEIIKNYEDVISYSICERCGKEGKLRSDLGWISTLCEEHYKEENND